MKPSFHDDMPMDSALGHVLDIKNAVETGELMAI